MSLSSEHDLAMPFLSLSHLLNQQEGLAPYLPKIEQIRELNSRFQRCLPQELKNLAYITRLEDEGAVLRVETSLNAVAARLRQLGPSLVAKLGLAPSPTLKVTLRPTVTRFPSSPTQDLTVRTLQEFEELAEVLTPSPLQNAIHSLLRQRGRPQKEG
ncbi:DciA family protein [Ferrovum myxofaciens]|jgi:hypothetical protein|uniref:DUF721 domain-containing protein n=2 Tax=root TaxID=1 RepID=A0A149VZG2_9PROT|nr:DciA family protein [Ferrovum myxofaciens]KXW58610.1 hypothetical protein FEMY_10090 [Ferrovum myxofaciens]MBW8028241.1 DUF721 domain-containing protein [Ferrovum sp.]NDU88635.1 DUF721 domain-containing protein [Ferrovum sp.]